MEAKLKAGQIPQTFARILSHIPIRDLTMAEKNMVKILARSGYLVKVDTEEGGEYRIKE
jgi:hypothetical protein